MNDGAHGLTMIPIIDMRPYTEGPGGNVHDTFDGVIAGKPHQRGRRREPHLARVRREGADLQGAG